MDTKNETPKNDFNATIGNTVLGVVYIVSKFNDGEHPYSDVIKIFKNRRIFKKETCNVCFDGC